MYKILISAASSPAAASLVKYLRSHDFYTIGISDKNTNFANSIFEEFHVVPPISSPDFLSAIVSLNFDFYLPWIDEEIELLINQAFIEKNKLSLPCIETFNTVINKNLFFEWCVKNNLSILEKTDRIPAFIRQNRSRGSKGAMKINCQDILQKYLNQNYISQKIVPEEFREYTVDVFSDHEGNLLHASPRIRVDAKNISYIGIVEKNKIAESVASNLALKLKIPGMWNFQLFINKEEYYLVEVNSRMAGSVIFTVLSGFPFDRYLYCLINKDFSNFTLPQIKNVYVERYLSEFVLEL